MKHEFLFSHSLKRGLFALGILFSQAAFGEIWTLERAVQTALASNPDAKMARLRIEGAESLIRQARSAWMPQLSVSGRYTETNSPMAAFGSILNQHAFSFGLDFNEPGQIDALHASGTLAYNLYSGGRASAALSAAKAGARAAKEDLKSTRQALSVEVVRAYLNLRKAREAVAAVEAGVKAYEAGVAVAKARHEAGSLLRADLLSIEVQLSQTREALIAARHAAGLAEHALTFVLGIEPPSDGIEILAEDVTLKKMTEPAQRDVSLRPELEAVRERIRGAEAQVAVARGARRPTVNAFASAQYDRGEATGNDAHSWIAGVSVDMNVFDGGRTGGQIRQAKAELAQAQEMLRKLQLGLRLEAERAGHAMSEARERLEVSAQAVQQAEESASLSRARFEQGALLAADLIGVEGRLIEARMRRVAAVADERVAVAELRRAVGLLPVDTVQP